MKLAASRHPDSCRFRIYGLGLRAISHHQEQLEQGTFHAAFAPHNHHTATAILVQGRLLEEALQVPADLRCWELAVRKSGP